MESSAGISDGALKFQNQHLYKLQQSLAAYRSLVKQKTKTETKSQLPYISNKDQASVQNSRLTARYSSLSNSDNKNMKYLFHEFCKQSYIGGSNATFDQIAMSAETMTMNKWMVFCKEFDLTKKLNTHDVKMIFKRATHLRSQMNYNAFCQALEIVRAQSKITEQEFVKDFLHIDSHLSARNRMCSMKVQFAGPRKNFFLEGRLTEKEREEEKMSEKKFKQKQRELILLQGKYQEHLQRELGERKKIREERVQNLRNKSMVNEPNVLRNDSLLLIQQNQTPYLRKTPSKVTKSSFGSYSNIFQTKKSNTTEVNSGRLSVNQKQQLESNSRLYFEKQRFTVGNDKNYAAFESSPNAEASRTSQESKIKQKWELDSSDSQSDEILRTHYQRQRLFHQSPIEKDERLPILEEDDRDTDFMVTRYT